MHAELYLQLFSSKGPCTMQLQFQVHLEMLFLVHCSSCTHDLGIESILTYNDHNQNMEPVPLLVVLQVKRQLTEVED